MPVVKIWDGAEWVEAGAFLIGGAGLTAIFWHVDGALAVGTEVGEARLLPQDMTFVKAYIYCKNPGTAGSTIVDINKNGVTIFTTQGNRPTLAWDDPDKKAVTVAPDVSTGVEGDIMAVDIDQIATGAGDLVIVLIFVGSEGTTTEIQEDDVKVVDVHVINFEGEGGRVTDEGGGKVTIDISRTFIQDADGDTKVQTEEAADEDMVRMDVAGVEAFLLHDDGILDLAKQSRARAWLDTPQLNLVSGDYIKVLLDAETYDSQNEFDVAVNHRFTPTTAGYYLAIGSVGWNQVVADKRYITMIYKNGACVTTGELYPGGGYPVSVATDVIYLDGVDDYLELYARHVAGVDTVDLNNVSDRTFLTIHKLS